MRRTQSLECVSKGSLLLLHHAIGHVAIIYIVPRTSEYQHARSWLARRAATGLALAHAPLPPLLIALPWR